MLLTTNEFNEKAVKYCGTFPEEGMTQLELLKTIGLRPNHQVLEIGCGALSAGIPIMDYLWEGNYTGIEPNQWLVDASTKIEQNLNAVLTKKPVFIYTDDFGEFMVDHIIKFDYIISHSVVSHVSINQFDRFLKNTSKMLKNGGFLLFSMLLVDGIKNETVSLEWQYPGSVFISRERLRINTFGHFSLMEERHDMKELIQKSHASSYHDWVLLTK